MIQGCYRGGDLVWRAWVAIQDTIRTQIRASLILLKHAGNNDFADSRPEPAIQTVARRTCSKTHVEKHCEQSAVQEVSQEPYNPQNDGPAHAKPLSSHLHLLLQNDLKRLPWGSLWDSFRNRNKPDVSQMAHHKHIENQ